ncbi:hypothetical protein BDW66DRAFT_146181 [Aspergillus desertorum]
MVALMGTPSAIPSMRAFRVCQAGTVTSLPAAMFASHYAALGVPFAADVAFGR